MDKAIITVLLIVCGVVATMTVFNEVLPAINQSQGAIASAAGDASDLILSRIEIIQTSASGNQMKFWVKNTGSSTIQGIANSDVIFGLSANAVPINYAGTTTPNWSFMILGDHDQWTPTVTICVTINLAAAPTPGTYLVRFVTPNGVSDETNFSAG
jgi:archaellum component FlaG (FlaF/FlaG flagellin family)